MAGHRVGQGRARQERAYHWEADRAEQRQRRKEPERAVRVRLELNAAGSAQSGGNEAEK